MNIQDALNLEKLDPNDVPTVVQVGRQTKRTVLAAQIASSGMDLNVIIMVVNFRCA
jgi:hypothetical protein